MAHPTVGTKHREYAREILQCSTKRAKVAWIGDSLMMVAGDGLQGMFPRIFNVSAVDGLEVTGASQYGISAGAASPGFGTTTALGPGGTTTILDFTGGKQNYAPEIAYECKCNGTAVEAQTDYRSNRVVGIVMYNDPAGRQTLHSPRLEGSTRYGDVWLNRLTAGGTLKLRVCFFAGPHCDESSRVFLQATNSTDWTKNIAQSDPFTLYQETAGFVMKELTIPATFEGAGTENTSTYWPLYFCVRVTEGAAMENKMIIPVGVELCVTGDTGYSQAFYSVGGATAATYLVPTSYSASCWEKFAAAGITHCVINLVVNGGTVQNMTDLIGAISTAVPGMKFILLAPYNNEAGSTARADALYAFAEANNHLWLSLEPWLPPLAIMSQSLTLAWATGAYFYEGDYVTSGGYQYLSANAHTAGTFADDLAALKWTAITGPAWGTGVGYLRADVRSTGGKQYRCLEPHNSGDFATDLAAGKWILITTIEANQIQQHTAGNRNFIRGADVHYSRGRGLALYAAGIMSLLNVAAAMPLAQNVRAGLAFGPDTAYPQKGTMPQAMVSI